MRIWDIDPGYLNRGNLLGEHAEAHAAYVVLAEGRKGYSRHPETRRWQGHLGALVRRHDLLAVEMRLRGYRHHSPLRYLDEMDWPTMYVDDPARQFELLRERYLQREPGRIPLPRDAQTLWAQHKYSLMARSPETSRQIGARVATNRYPLPDLARDLVHWLRRPVAVGGMRNALQHMWGYVNGWADGGQPEDSVALLQSVQNLALEHQVTYLVHSTALGELGYWLEFSDLA